MAKSFRKRIVKKIKRVLRRDEIKDILEKEFTDSHENKVKIRFDFKPHSIKEPTIQWQRDYGDEE